MNASVNIVDFGLANAFTLTRWRAVALIKAIRLFLYICCHIGLVNNDFHIGILMELTLVSSWMLNMQYGKTGHMDPLIT